MVSGHADADTGERPLISVVVPVYNAERYVEQAVRSALDQQRDVEVVLVEDGSTDGSLALCERLASECERVCLVRHQGGENRGPGASRNLGIRESRGQYIAFLDADDYYLRGRFDQDIEIMEKDPAVEGVYSAVVTVFEDDAAPNDPCPDMTTLKGPIEPEALFSTLLLGKRGRFCTDGIAVRRTVFEKTGPFDEGLVLGEDSAMWLKMAAVCHLVAGSIDEPVAVRRRHPGNMSTPANPLWREAPRRYLACVLSWAEGAGLEPEKLGLLRDGLVTRILH
ncbi:MAG: glycosyltransferase family 2 protein, partial [Planctomycetota bacterium]